MKDVIGKTTLTGTGNAFAFMAGFFCSPLEDFTLGTSVQYFSGTTIALRQNNTSLNLNFPSGRKPNTATKLESANFRLSHPLNAQIGASYRIFPSLTIFAGTEFQQWAKLKNHYSNVFQKHFGIKYSPISMAVFRCGYFTQKNADREIRKFDQQFLTAGFEFHYNNLFVFSVSGATNSFFANPNVPSKNFIEIKDFHQTILKTAIEIRL